MTEQNKTDKKVTRLKAKLTVKESKESLARAKADLLETDGDLEQLLKEGATDDKSTEVCPDTEDG